jgi:SAM-dependent methyltransferase
VPEQSNDHSGVAALGRRFARAGARRVWRGVRRRVLERPEVVVDVGYRTILQRWPDEHGRRDYVAQLRARQLSVEQFGRRLVDSREFEQLSAGLELGLSLHRSRCAFVRSFPEARRILDLGGTDLTHEYGALVTMGYPYAFDELVIVDLPPTDRHPIYNRGGTRDEVKTPNGLVRYAYHSMADLSPYADGSFDLVYSGQTIEHVPLELADSILAGAYRVLRPGGHLALDTPNARLTRLQQDEMIDPDHTYEYTVAEIEAKVRAAGFEIVERKGLNLGRGSVERGSFEMTEVARNVGLFSDVESCYLTALVCRRS